MNKGVFRGQNSNITVITVLAGTLRAFRNIQRPERAPFGAMNVTIRDPADKKGVRGVVNIRTLI